MLKMLLSINPEHVANILNGIKRYEYRKKRCKADIDTIIIYATTPQKQIVGEVTIKNIIEDEPIKVWEKTKEFSGISYDFFQKYFKGKKNAIAYELDNLIIYDKPLLLSDIGITHAPQSFRYIKT